MRKRNYLSDFKYFSSTWNPFILNFAKPTSMGKYIQQETNITLLMIYCIFESMRFSYYKDYKLFSNKILRKGLVIKLCKNHQNVIKNLEIISIWFFDLNVHLRQNSFHTDMFVSNNEFKFGRIIRIQTLYLIVVSKKHNHCYNIKQLLSISYHNYW